MKNYRSVLHAFGLCIFLTANLQAQQYYIHFPDDVILTNCPPGGFDGEPVVLGSDCPLLDIFYEDAIFGITDYCYTITREWTIINWCNDDPAIYPVGIPNPQPVHAASDPANLPGPIVSACDALPPWNPTIVKAFWSDTAVTNYCKYWSPNPNAYHYNQKIGIIDWEPPLIGNCPLAPATFADTTANDNNLWNNVFNPDLPPQDLTEIETDLSITATDVCSGSNIYLKFQLFLDLDGDQVTETVVNSEDLGNYPWNLGWNKILYGNVTGVGEPRQFDNRPVPDDQKWGFALQETFDSNYVSASVKFNTSLAHNIYVTPQLPQGTHKIKWTAQDGCGNETTCEHVFTIQAGLISNLEPVEGEDFALFQNEPNPFTHNTTIGFRLPVAGETTVSVYDTGGRRLFQKTSFFAEGFNSLQLEGSWLHTSGILYYKMESGPNVAWRKMVLTR